MTRPRFARTLALPLGLLATLAAVAAAPPARARDRQSTVRDAIAARNASLPARDREAKLARMAESPSSFFRGTSHLFWSDLGRDARLGRYGGPKTRTWILGDAHAGNFGSFGNAEGRLVYDLNDFDDAIVADYQLDLWRMATSVVLEAREHGELEQDDVVEGIEAFARAYLEAVIGFVGNDDEKTFVVDAKNAYGKLDEFLADVAKELTREKMLKRWTKLDDGERVLAVADEELEAVDAAFFEKVVAAMEGYRATLAGGPSGADDFFAVKSVARRLDAGFGSLGLPRYYVLIEGLAPSADDDRILDVKLQPAPAGFDSLSKKERADYEQRFESHAHRASVGYRAMSTHTDDLQGTLTLGDGAYTVRELSPQKDKFPFGKLESKKRLRKLCEQWGKILAAAHCRADDDFDPGAIDYSFEAEVAKRAKGDADGFVALVREIALGYAAQVEKDHAAFVAGR